MFQHLLLLNFYWHEGTISTTGWMLDEVWIIPLLSILMSLSATGIEKAYEEHGSIEKLAKTKQCILIGCMYCECDIITSYDGENEKLTPVWIINKVT